MNSHIVARTAKRIAAVAAACVATAALASAASAAVPAAGHPHSASGLTSGLTTGPFGLDSEDNTQWHQPPP